MVSIIIPVYNCENYLHMSISSLINQTIFNNLELIFVDDGSTDNSREIINEYVHVYSNMKLITQENSGVSVARNNGIKHSNGDFISFFDADDIAEPALYETLQSLLIDNNADISVINYNMVFENGVSKKHKPTLKKIYNSKNEALKSFFTENFICTNPFDKMFSRQVVDKISFPEGFAIGEDMFFVYKAICAADKLVIDTTNSLYNYCLHSDSAMKTHFSDKHFDAVLLSKQILNDFCPDDPLYNYAEANYIHEICKMLGLLYRENNGHAYKKKASPYRQYLNSYSILKAINYMDKKHAMALELMKLSPKLYVFIYKLLKVG